MNAVRCASALLGALSFAGCGGGATIAPSTTSAQAAIWVHPRPYLPGGAGVPAGGSTDFLSVFSGTSAWPESAAHTSVFGFYAGWSASIDTATLASVVAFLNTQHMSVELEAPSLQATASCGNGVEGYVPYGGQSLHDFTILYLQRLRAAGADVRYVKVDEPYFFGSVSPDPRACRWPISQVAQDVAQFAALVHTIYPNADVGDVEPIIEVPYSPDVVTAMSSWQDAYKAAAGAAFPFFVADMDYGDPAWPLVAVKVQNAIHARGERFGIIYIGDLTDTSDAQWAGKAVERFQTFASTSGSAPDFVLFQSWEPYPQYCLPESDPTTLMGVVKAYIDSRATAGAVRSRVRRLRSEERSRYLVGMEALVGLETVLVGSL